MKRKLLNSFLFLVTVSLVLLLISVVDVKEMIKTLLSVRVSFYIAAFISYIAAYYAKTLRLSVLFRQQSQADLFLMASAHMFINHFLPFRTGEFSLLFFLKRIAGVQYSISASLLVLLRLFDFIAIVFTFLFFLILLKLEIDSRAIWLGAVFFIVCSVAVFKLKAIFCWLMKTISKLSSQSYADKMEKVSKSINEALTLDTFQLFKLFTLSLLDRMLNYTMTVLLVLGMSYQIPVLHLLLANAVASVTSILPVNSLGSFGTLELGWAGILILLGIPTEVAVSSGFNFHLLVLTFTISLGVVSLWIMNNRFNINPFKQSS